MTETKEELLDKCPEDKDEFDRMVEVMLQAVEDNPRGRN